MSTIPEIINKKKNQSPQFEYLWKIEMPSLAVSFEYFDIFDYYAEPLNYVMDTSRTPGEISHRVTSVEAPNPKFESKKNTLASSYFYTAINNDIGSVTLKIDELDDGLTLAYFHCWMKMIAEPNYGMYYPPAFYKRNINVVRLDTLSNETHRSTYHGYFPTDISAIGYNYDGTGVMQYSVTLTGDSVSHVLLTPPEIQALSNSAQGKFKNDVGVGGFSLNQEISDITGDITEGISGALSTAGGYVSDGFDDVVGYASDALPGTYQFPDIDFPEPPPGEYQFPDVTTLTGELPGLYEASTKIFS
jgi:hypothetical protein